MCSKLVAVRINKHPRNSSLFQKELQKLVSKDMFLKLKGFVLKMRSTYGSTHVRESTFSTILLAYGGFPASCILCLLRKGKHSHGT